MRLLPAIVILAACTASPPQFPVSGAAQETDRRVDPISGLHAALAAGDLAVTDVRGKGASSGIVLDANLRNTTARSIRVGVRLSRGLYFANRNPTAQNMIATAVYERGGQYYLEDDEPFIEVLPHQVKGITFNGYCLDFDLENPADSDSLVLQPVPPELSNIVHKLLAYEQATGDHEHSAVRAQVALWLARGHAPEEIRERFDFAPADLDEAYGILAGTF